MCHRSHDLVMSEEKKELDDFFDKLMNAPGKKDDLDQYRGEYNRMLRDKAEATQNMVRLDVCYF